MSVPEKITPIGDAGLGNILPGGEPDLPISALPFMLHVQKTSNFLDDVKHPASLLRPRPKLGDFLAPYGDERFACYPGEKGFLFQVAMTTWRWLQKDLAGSVVAPPYYTKPKDLDWLPNPDNPGKKICIAMSTGDATTIVTHARTADRYDKQTLSFMLVEGAYPVIFCFASTNREIGDELGRRVGRWKVDGKDAPMLGLFRMTSVPASNAKGHWFAPSWAYVAKFGDKDGPSAAWTRRAAELRRALKGDGVFEAPVGPPEPPTPPEPPALEERRGSIDIRSGKGAWDDAPPTPPIDDDMPF
jgi:hypothetical protein